MKPHWRTRFIHLRRGILRTPRRPARSERLWDSRGSFSVYLTGKGNRGQNNAALGDKGTHPQSASKWQPEHHTLCNASGQCKWCRQYRWPRSHKRRRPSGPGSAIKIRSPKPRAIVASAICASIVPGKVCSPSNPSRVGNKVLPVTRSCMRDDEAAGCRRGGADKHGTPVERHTRVMSPACSLLARLICNVGVRLASLSDGRFCFR